MDELQNLEQLLQELLNGIQDVLQSGEILSDDFQLLLANELNYLTDRIDQLRAENITPPVTALPPEQMNQAMPSSNISRFAYDDKNNRLIVQFLGKWPDPNGPQYAYENVPPEIFNLFRIGAVPARTDGRNAWARWWKGKWPSIGASLYTLLRLGGYQYQRLT